MNTKTAPQSAKMPPVTREVIAIWEKELDEFVIDIQTRLETIAESISGRNEDPLPPQEQPEPPSEIAAAIVDMPTTAVAPVQEPPSVHGQPIVQQRPLVQDQPIHPGQREIQDPTDDRLQAIKEKLAARLQGESS